MERNSEICEVDTFCYVPFQKENSASFCNMTGRATM